MSDKILFGLAMFLRISSTLIICLPWSDFETCLCTLENTCSCIYACLELTLQYIVSGVYFES